MQVETRTDDQFAWLSLAFGNT